ncbi:putative aldouronate transport system permease protein [Paenibacillus sp. cl141a]|uniref:carbohydrate ABC transporter permease n=1 Tax=Paenibacillus sp. cl141a TaxID=1761877 RepID=UPI0008CAD823|nr:carbohydrate ABC transporter permease [Paenibacillus sp. cl141a]SEL94789.1 putative aldouronate transport system permease protein [Paenibacillus sp. cl141a]
MVKGTNDRFFNSIVYVLLAIVAVSCLFPILYVVSVSLTPYSEVIKNGGFQVIPQKLTFDAYRSLLIERTLPKSMGVSVVITILGTALSLLLTLLGAYPLSRKNLPGRTPILLFIVFTMLFSGGLIPTYLVVKDLGLTNTIWAMIVPNALATFNMLIMKTFFESLPEELFESARIDGAREFRILWKIAIPLSIPSLMTIGLFYMVAQWNTFFSAIIYITNRELHPLQVVVRNMLTMSQSTEMAAEAIMPTMTLQMAAVVLASLPIILVYPFIQKHLTKGMMIGAIKG